MTRSILALVAVVLVGCPDEGAAISGYSPSITQVYTVDLGNCAGGTEVADVPHVDAIATVMVCTEASSIPNQQHEGLGCSEIRGYGYVQQWEDKIVVNCASIDDVDSVQVRWVVPPING